MGTFKEAPTIKVLIEALSSKFNLKVEKLETASGFQTGPALFTGAGRQIHRDSELALDQRTLLVFIEGGVWQWPPVHVGFQRPLGELRDKCVQTVLRTLSLKPRVFEITNFLTTE